MRLRGCEAARLGIQESSWRCSAAMLGIADGCFKVSRCLVCAED